MSSVKRLGEARRGKGCEPFATLWCNDLLSAACALDPVALRLWLLLHANYRPPEVTGRTGEAFASFKQAVEMAGHGRSAIAGAFRRLRASGLAVLVREGSRPRAQGAAAVEVALRAALMPTTHFMNPFNVTAVDTGRGLVLFDTGNGRESGPETGLLAANMRAAGLDPARVAQVVMTHFHPDHIGGLALNDGAAVFPNSEIVVGAREWAYWTDGGEESRAPEARRPLFANVRRRFAPYEGRVRRIEHGAEVAPGARALATHGHTPGHLTYQVSDGADVLMVLGDLTNRPEFNLRHPGWHMAVDQDPQMAEATRRRMFDRVAAERARCVGYHWPFPANGHIVKEGDGYRLVPADWSSQV